MLSPLSFLSGIRASVSVSVNLKLSSKRRGASRRNIIICAAASPLGSRTVWYYMYPSLAIWLPYRVHRLCDW